MFVLSRALLCVRTERCSVVQTTLQLWCWCVSLIVRPINQITNRESRGTPRLCLSTLIEHTAQQHRHHFLSVPWLAAVRCVVLLQARYSGAYTLLRVALLAPVATGISGAVVRCGV